jgi:hypothetical protein
MVGLGRLELPTSRLSSARSNQLSYKPKSRSPIIGSPNDRKTHSSRQAHAQTSQNNPHIKEERETKTAPISRLTGPDKDR